MPEKRESRPGIWLAEGLSGCYCNCMALAAVKRGNRKYNWEPVERDMVKGLTTRELSEKYSIPSGRIMARRREMRLKNAELVLLQPNCGMGDSGLPAPLARKPQKVTQNSEKTELAAESPSPCELTNDQLVSLLADPAAFLALKPEDAEKAIGKRVQGMLAQALANPPEARTLKDVATLHKIFRDANGLTAKEGKGGNGLLSPPRAFGRRAVAVPVDAIEVEPADGWEDMGEI